jgi:hypothetical protein
MMRRRRSTFDDRRGIRSTFDDPRGIRFCGKRLPVEGVELPPAGRPLPLDSPVRTPE